MRAMRLDRCGASVSARRVSTDTCGSLKPVQLCGGAGGLSSVRCGEETCDAHSALPAVWAQPQYHRGLHHRTLYSHTSQQFGVIAVTFTQEALYYSAF